MTSASKRLSFEDCSYLAKLRQTEKKEEARRAT